MARIAYDGSGFLTFYQQLAVNNPCYKQNGNRLRTTHLILHSTGANNPNLKRYVTPDDGYLGENPYNNGWNNPNSSTLVHAVIGKNKNGVVEVYQIAPWGKLVWGCGSGRNGSGNSFAIQVEMCEDQTLGVSYAKETYHAAVKLFAFLCKAFDIEPENIWSHNEAHGKGYASGHVDPEHWWKAVGAGLSMDGFRKDVKSLLSGEKSEGETASGKTETTTREEATPLYRVQLGAFSVKKNATAKCNAVKAAGFDAFVVPVGALWKVQVGAFAVRANADAMVRKLQAAGFSGLVVKSSGSAASETISHGSTVRVKKGAKTYDGVSLETFVYNRDHEVKSIVGDRVVITYNGIVIAAVRKDDLILV